jgi:hypothetical protein
MPSGELELTDDGKCAISIVAFVNAMDWRSAFAKKLNHFKICEGVAFGQKSLFCKKIA